MLPAPDGKGSFGLKNVNRCNGQQSSSSNTNGMVTTIGFDRSPKRKKKTDNV